MGQVAQDLRPKTVSDHIRELQMRVIVSVVSLFSATVVAYLFYTPILAFLSAPLHAPLYYTSPAGGFTFIIKICTMCAVIFTIPILFFNLIMFVRPAFSKILTMKLVIITTLSSTALAIAGAAFAFYSILPGSLEFFKGYQVSGLSALISADSYLGFVTSMIITFAIVFQIPLVIGFIDSIKPLSPRQLLRLEKWVVIGSLVAALLAPFTYDFVTSILMAVPIIVLYNLSIIVVIYRHSKLKNKQPSAVIANSRPDFALNEDLIEDLATNLVLRPQLVSSVSTIQTHAYMDIRKLGVKPASVKKAQWMIDRDARRAELSKHVKVISDFRMPAPRINRASA